MRSMWRAESRKNATSAPRPRSSTAKASKARKKGARIDPHGYDAGKKIKGKKRHILVDTLGLLLSAAVHPADIQDRDGAALVLDSGTRASFPFIVRIFADAGYQGPRAALAAAASGDWIIEIVKRSELLPSSCCPGDGSSNAPSPG